MMVTVDKAITKAHFREELLKARQWASDCLALEEEEEAFELDYFQVSYLEALEAIAESYLTDLVHTVKRVIEDGEVKPMQDVDGNPIFLEDGDTCDWLHDLERDELVMAYRGLAESLNVSYGAITRSLEAQAEAKAHMDFADMLRQLRQYGGTRWSNIPSRP